MVQRPVHPRNDKGVLGFLSRLHYVDTSESPLAPTVTAYERLRVYEMRGDRIAGRKGSWRKEVAITGGWV